MGWLGIGMVLTPNLVYMVLTWKIVESMTPGFTKKKIISALHLI